MDHSKADVHSESAGFSAFASGYQAPKYSFGIHYYCLSLCLPALVYITVCLAANLTRLGPCVSDAYVLLMNHFIGQVEL
ncbi:hypothetical protein GQ53DRAFT_755707 [Thozetella sp. PMI_491]|nr:hypothetical protein GQ53DRAFT_755707 [Thozetella sp. PMI_491]